MTEPAGPKPRQLSGQRCLIYLVLAVTALLFLAPLYVMLATSLKDMPEIRGGNVLAFPSTFYFGAWGEAWAKACTGLRCNGISVGFWNSLRITVPAVALCVLFGVINGYTLSFWRFRGANLLFGVLMTGAFVPYQVFLFPLVRIYAAIGIFGTLPGIVLVHVIFALPAMTLMFRNWYASIPEQLFKAARVDGAGYVRILVSLMLPMSGPIIMVAVIWQATAVWNDFLLGLVFAGRENLPMTVQLNNIVNAGSGEQRYNVNMAATVLTSLVPLAIYFFSGRWFVRGITAGAMKG